MPRKDVYLFDATNNPLKVAGIRLELFDAVTCALLDVKNSANLNPSAGTTSSEWGGQLTFTAGSNPLDIYVTDKTYKYPGNTVRYLNGQTGDRLDIDLLTLPASTGGQPTLPGMATPMSISLWVEQAPKWTKIEKRAVRNLVFNYIDIVIARQAEYSQLPFELANLASNWEEALRRVGLPPDLLQK